MQIPPLCIHCGSFARLTTGREVYPHRADLRPLRFWACAPCEAFVGCHKPGAFVDLADGRRLESDGTLPLGRPANAALRQQRSAVHAQLDRLWRSSDKPGRRRRFVYAELGLRMGLSVDETHVGLFDGPRCEQALEALVGVRDALLVEIRAKRL